MRAHRYASVALTAVLVFAFACSSDGGETVDPSGFGTVTGTVTAANNATPIPDALVSVRDQPSVQSATTDQDGAYTLQNVPAGIQTIIARRGSFEANVSVNVRAGQSTAAPRAALISSGKLAYVAGLYDSIEEIVQNQLGNPIDEITADQLSSSAITSQYRIIFLNCGMDDSFAQDPATVANLRSFMQNGGTIYASDWAVAYAKGLFPNDLTHSADGDDQTVNATIVDASLQAFVGKTNVSITYDLPAWEVLSFVSANARVLLRGSYTTFGTPQQNQPLAIILTHGQGRLVYTTFHNEAAPTPDQIAVLRHFVYLP